MCGSHRSCCYLGADASYEALGIGCLLIGSSLLGSLLPDIDHPQSKISKKNPILAALVNLILVIGKTITQLILLLCFWMSKKRKEQILRGFEHRGIFHTLLIAVLLYLCLALLPSYWGRAIQIGLVSGYISHLLMDMLTVSGVRILYPIITKSFHWPFIRLHTGNKAHEMIARIIFIVITILVLSFGARWGLYGVLLK